MRSKCNTCEAAGRQSMFDHIDPVVLFRLRDVESLWDELPFDPEWPFGKDHSMHRTHTSNLDLDVSYRYLTTADAEFGRWDYEFAASNLQVGLLFNF